MKSPKVWTFNEFIKLPKWYLDYLDKQDRQKIILHTGEKIEKRIGYKQVSEKPSTDGAS